LFVHTSNTHHHQHHQQQQQQHIIIVVAKLYHQASTQKNVCNCFKRNVAAEQNIPEHPKIMFWRISVMMMTTKTKTKKNES